MMYKQTLVETLTDYIPSKVYKKKIDISSGDMAMIKKMI